MLRLRINDGQNAIRTGSPLLAMIDPAAAGTLSLAGLRLPTRCRYRLPATLLPPNIAT